MPADDTMIRPFPPLNYPEADLADLRRRVSATRWPEQETVTDDSQGVPLAMMQELARYWAADYEWRGCEARLNALPMFVTEIDGLGVHFIHVRSRHEESLPLIITHGWPGSVLEQLKIIGPLTDPTAHGASEADAFHLVIPSLPGHGFSAKPATTGWDPVRIARAWAELMSRLGYTQYVGRAATGARRSPRRWASRRHRGWLASTPTCRGPLRPRSTSPCSAATRRRPACPPRRSPPTSSWSPSTRSTWPTRRS